MQQIETLNDGDTISLRAAQYLRMSTDLQQYSPQNQAVVIAAYAAKHNLTIVRTYIDEGRSGLRISNRQALTDLMDDVCSRNAQFDYLLVYDVSRWGRFQDIDESAHYEFLCRQAGIKVAYCAEQFPNDQSLMSGILKNLKRVMAAEYILNRTDGVASPALYALRFGSLRKAFKLVGYRPTRNYGHIDSRAQVTERIEQKAFEIARRIRALGAAALFDANTDTMVVDNRVTVSFRAARYYHQPNKPVLWNINRRTRLPSGLILALRLNKKNNNVLDYFLMPTTEMTNRRIALTATSRSRFASYRVATVAKVVLTIMETVAISNVRLSAERKTRRCL